MSSVENAAFAAWFLHGGMNLPGLSGLSSIIGIASSYHYVIRITMIMIVILTISIIECNLSGLPKSTVMLLITTLFV